MIPSLLLVVRQLIQLVQWFLFGKYLVTHCSVVLLDHQSSTHLLMACPHIDVLHLQVLECHPLYLSPVGPLVPCLYLRNVVLQFL